ncbi:hypothetical protein EGW08_004031 [Elysia chlorotica]|uniref:Uncharacterized protein n=1 Tax=Elysia chlorotica TaxID=188477 RepID=A0A433U2Y5_ELYCH|nr:hypothetical protein EGW08_004031 [Elysia chlorotica]
MSSLRSSSVGVMRPPKPPCWRDFVVSSARSFAATDALDTFQETAGRALGSRCAVTDLEPLGPSNSRPSALSAAPGARIGRLARRPRARIHRTRSEHVILPEDLPDSSGATPVPRTAAVPEDSRPALRPRPRALTPDDQIDVEENNKRCQNWLASIEAAEPLDEVDYNSLGELGQEQSSVKNVPLARRDIDLDLRGEAKTSNEEEDEHITELGQATVEMEIPEETFQWEEDAFPPSDSHRETRHRFPTDSDAGECRACKVSARGGGVSANTPVPSGSNSRKFTGPPLCGTCTDCISCGSGDPSSSGASENNTQYTGRAINVEDRSRVLCTCTHSPTSPKSANKRSILRKSLSSKTPGFRPGTDRSTSSPAVTRSSGRMVFMGIGRWRWWRWSWRRWPVRQIGPKAAADC